MSEEKASEKQVFSTLHWLKATFYGWLLGVAFIILLSSILDGIGIEHMQFYLGVGMSAGVSLTQWWWFRKTLPLTVKWIWYALLGMGIPIVILDFLPEGWLSHPLAYSIATGALCAGLLQSGLLKPLFKNAWWWVVANFAGWCLAVLTVFTMDYTKNLDIPNLLIALINLLLILAGGIVLGLFTGWMMKKIITGKQSL